MNEIKQIQVYGADWCPDCRMAKSYFEKKAIEYKYFNIEEGENMQEMLEITGGSKTIPAILIDGKLYKEPSLIELKEALK